MKFKTHFSLVALMLLLVACNQPSTPTTSTPDQPVSATTSDLLIANAKAEIKSGDAVLVDVREQIEWDVEHLADAVFIPMSEIEADISAVKTLDKSTRIYVHCRSGRRACMMADLLNENGYDVVPLKVDYEDLVEAGFDQAKE